MTIKKYLASTETEAIEMAKEDLGKNAIVMNIKKIHPKGLMKLFMKGKVEVTAAVEENGPDGGAAAGDAGKEKGGAAAAGAAAAFDAAAKSPAGEEKPLTPDEKSIQDKLMTLQLLLEKQMQEKGGRPSEQRAAAPPAARKEENAPADNITAAEKEPAREASGEEPESKAKVCRELILKHLLENEVEEEIANSLLEEVYNSLPSEPAVDQILATVYQKIILMMGQPYLIQPEKRDKTQYVFFLGSTGVGKTTTIAKIASKLKLEKKADIALVTADTYRIAAVEQLKTYANILSVPLKVIYSPEELGVSLGELGKYDLCLVDTAGRSHRNKNQIEDIRKLIEQVPIGDRQVYLVLNAGTKYKDLQEIASVYAKLTDFSIIFTKLDETSSSGAMLNMKIKTKCPLSYVTWGQNVPDDMGVVDPQKVAKGLLSGNAGTG